MAQIKGTNVGSPVVPFDTADANPSHEAKYGKGGYRTAATTAERDAIPAARREAGMLVFVAEDETIYQLGADLATWTEFSSGATYDQSLNTTDAVTFASVSLPNGTKITEGSWDNGTGGQNGISLHCTVGYELNWQGGHLQSTSDGGETTATIWCDSPIQFPGEGAASVQVDATGLTFSDGSQQRIAGVASAHSHAAGDVAYPTALLLHFDGTDGGTTFTDSSPNGWTVSRIGSAVTSTTQHRFGGSSLAFSLGDGVSIAADPALHVGANDFTIEFWGYLTAGSVLASQRGAGGFAWTIASNTVYWNYDSMGFPQVSFFAWHHYALVRHAGFLRLYVDGAEACSSEIGNAVIGPSTDYIGIGRDAEGNLSAGWIDDFRMVLGTAIYRAPFIPPTAPHGLGLELATVATSGSYDDLVDLPTLFSGDYDDLTNAPALGAVATSNDYGDLDNLPTLGSAAASDTTDFAAATHSHAWSDLTSGVPTTLSGYGITDAVASNDSRLTDARSPTAHKTSHATGGTDALSAADIGAAAASHTHAASDITSGTIATARLGSGTADATTYLRGDQTYAAAPVTSVDGLTGAVTINRAAIYDFQTGSGPSGATSGGSGSWTWSLPSWAKWVEIYAIGGGSGGGSGRRGAASSLAGGGAGGAGGVVSQTRILVSDLSTTTLWIQVGAGGGGGSGVTSDGTNGNGGTTGGQSAIRLTNSTGAIVLQQDGNSYASNGQGGTGTAGGTGAGHAGVSWGIGNAAQGANGGDGTTAVGSPNINTGLLATPSGGGGGGGLSSGNATQSGGVSNWPYRGRSSDGYGTGATGGTAGNAGSAGGTAYAAWGRVGIGGGGGGSSTTGNAGAGGDGGFPGGGGGGGGASRNATGTSGKGGNGADGLVRIICWG